MINRDTFVRFADKTLRWAVGEFAHRLTSVVAGLSSDTIADGVRQLVRWTMPLYDTPVDVLPILLRNYGMPSYTEAYAATMARLRIPWDVHQTAGSQSMLEAELERAGFVGATIETDVDSSFWVVYGNGATPTYGSGITYGTPGLVYGSQVTADQAHNVKRLMSYFRPAREFWRGIKVAP